MQDFLLINLHCCEENYKVSYQCGLLFTLQISSCAWVQERAYPGLRNGLGFERFHGADLAPGRFRFLATYKPSLF